MKEYTLRPKIQISQEEVDNIIDNAMNNCSYWCIEASITKWPEEEHKYTSEIITRGGELTFKLEEPYVEGGATEFVLTIDKMIGALERYGEYDFEMFDGLMADAVLQLALFGEIIYG